MPRPMVLENQIVSPPEGNFWTTPEMFNEKTHRPSYTRRQVAEFFFARSPAWMRKQAFEPTLYYEGELFVFSERIPMNSSGRYEFRLWDVERFAHVLIENDIIDVAQLERTLLLIKTVAENYGYLK